MGRPEPGDPLRRAGSGRRCRGRAGSGGSRVAAGAARQHGLAAHPRAWTGPNDGAVRCRTRTDGRRSCRGRLCRQSGPHGRAGGRHACRSPSRPGRLFHGGSRTRRAALPRAQSRCRRQGRSRRWPDQWRRHAAAQPDRMRAMATGGELTFPGTEVSPGDDLGVAGGRPRSRAGERFGTQSGCRGGHEARPQRCWAAWRVMPSREPISAQE